MNGNRPSLLLRDCAALRRAVDELAEASPRDAKGNTVDSGRLVDDPAPLCIHVAQRFLEGLHGTGLIAACALDLDPNALVPSLDNQVDLRPGRRAPEERLRFGVMHLLPPEDILYDEGFPACAAHRMRQQLLLRGNTRQVVHQSGVADIDPVSRI